MVEACERRIWNSRYAWTLARSPRNLNLRAGMPGRRNTQALLPGSGACEQKPGPEERK